MDGACLLVYPRDKIAIDKDREREECVYQGENTCEVTLDLLNAGNDPVHNQFQPCSFIGMLFTKD